MSKSTVKDGDTTPPGLILLPPEKALQVDLPNVDVEQSLTASPSTLAEVGRPTPKPEEP